MAALCSLVKQQPTLNRGFCVNFVGEVKCLKFLWYNRFGTSNWLSKNLLNWPNIQLQITCVVLLCIYIGEWKWNYIYISMYVAVILFTDRRFIHTYDWLLSHKCEQKSKRMFVLNHVVRQKTCYFQRPFTVTILLFCIVSEIRRLIIRKSRNFHNPPAFSVSFRGTPSPNFVTKRKLEWLGYRRLNTKRLTVLAQYMRVPHGRDC